MATAAQGFNVRLVEKLIGLTHRQLSHWDKTGIIKPSVRAARGPGSRRLYSFEDLVELRVVATLRQSGVSLQAVRRAVAYLHRHHAQLRRPLAALTFITDGKDVFTLTDKPSVVSTITADGQLVAFVVGVAGIVRTLQEKVAVISKPRVLSVRVGGRTVEAVLTPDLEAGGFSVEIPSMPGCITEGDDVAECRANIREVVSLWLEGDAARAAS